MVLSVLLIIAPAISAELPAAVSDDEFRTYSKAKIALGRLLFYDRVLSGTFRVSCATCHNPDRASSNGFRNDQKPNAETDELAVNGLPVYDALKPSAEHAPALFNLGAKQFTRMFSDGRVEQMQDGSFATFVGNELPEGLSDILSVQALFPTITDDELVGTVENELSAAARESKAAIWAALAKRIIELAEYEPFILAAFPELADYREVTIAEIGNAIGAFVATEWRSTNSPFDKYLSGDKTALSQIQVKGMGVFYGKGNCSSCHSGVFQTDHKFYSVGLPVWRSDMDMDEIKEAKIRTGRGNVTGEIDRTYAYRTPSLRNVEMTAPYGQAGSYANLPGFLNAHLSSGESAQRFLEAKEGYSEAQFPELKKVAQDIYDENQIKPVSLNESEFSALMSFLTALTDKDSLRGKLGRPEEVPSSLALD